MDTMDRTHFQFVEIGRIVHGFWKYHDRAHRQYVPDSGLEDVVRDHARIWTKRLARS
jgi:hypothetical protein